MSAGPPKPRVGLLSERADLYGGGQRSLRDLALALHGSEVEPLVILPGPGPLMGALAVAGISVAFTPLPALRAGGGVSALLALWRLVGLIRRERLDLLHSDAPRAALYGGLAARLTGRGHVWHLRASRPSSGLADRLLLGLSHAVIAVSNAAARRSPALRASRKVRVVPTGIPPFTPIERAAARRDLGLPGDRFIAGVIGRVERDKGSEEALAAVAILRRTVPQAMLAFLGPVDPRDGWSAQLRLRAATLGLSEAVRYVGERAEAAPLLRAFDVVLHPSRHEALPRVLIEALCAGVPIVASAVGGVSEIVVSGECGLLAAPGDAAALGRATARLAADPDLRDRLVRAGLARASRLFSVGTMRDAVVSLYATLLRNDAVTALRTGEAAR